MYDDIEMLKIEAQRQRENQDFNESNSEGSNQPESYRLASDVLVGVVDPSTLPYYEKNNEKLEKIIDQISEEL